VYSQPGFLQNGYWVKLLYMTRDHASWKLEMCRIYVEVYVEVERLRLGAGEKFRRTEKMEEEVDSVRLKCSLT
jgi:hypothetical protein